MAIDAIAKYCLLCTPTPVLHIPRLIAEMVDLLDGVRVQLYFSDSFEQRQLMLDLLKVIAHLS